MGGFKRGQFEIVISPDDTVDLHDISDPQVYAQIKIMVQHLVKSGTVTDVGLAYIAAAITFIMDRQLLIGEYDPDVDKFH